ncbi:hypothetical protein ACFL59_03300 [Planctomycetota bacterium]
MEIRSWKPDEPLGAAGAISIADRAIYERLFSPRSSVADYPESLTEVMTHCTRQFQLRDLEREVVEIIPPALESIAWRDPDASPFDPCRPDLKILSREVGSFALASTLARKRLRGMRALIRVLLLSSPSATR